MILKKILSSLLIIAALLVPSITSAEQFKLNYKSQEVLKKFDESINYPYRLFEKIPLKTKLDRIHKRVKSILKIKKKTGHIIINLYTREDYIKFYETEKERYKFIWKNLETIPEAWYVHSERTIYINVDNIDENVLAHEITHSIVDDCLWTIPPGKIGEIVARHVDKNLHKE